MSFSPETVHAPRDGDFLSFETPRRNPVSEAPRPLRDPIEIDGVRFDRELYTLADGQRYPVTTARLPLDQRSTDILTASSAAWTTKGGGGFNLRDQLFLARDLGMESFLVDTAQSLGRFSHIEDDARNQLEIAEYLTLAGDYRARPLIVTGISHGAMNAMTATALAGEYDRKVWAGYYRGPCFPNHITETDIRGNIGKVANELGGIANMLTTVSPFALRHYGSTLNLGPRGVLRHLRDVPTLLGGRVGELVRDQLPRDAFGYVSVRDGDALSQAQDWEETLDKHPLMLVDRRAGGSHIEECAGEQATRKWKGVMTAINNALRDHEEALAQIDERPNGSASTGLSYIVSDERPDIFVAPFRSRNRYAA